LYTAAFKGSIMLPAALLLAALLATLGSGFGFYGSILKG
jgi:hypothetical protein